MFPFLTFIALFLEWLPLIISVQAVFSIYSTVFLIMFLSPNSVLVLIPCTPTFLFLVPGELIFLSDGQKGLLDGVHNNFPESPHGYCLKHLAEDFYKP
jgi:hypothetical protein